MTSSVIDARDSLDAVRADVHRAGAVVAPSWPLSSTIAVNPLSGFEHLPFAAAIATASELFGTRGYLTETEFRSAWESGRVRDADLDAALLRLRPSLAADGLDTARAKFLAAPETDPPRRILLTVAEQWDRRHGDDLHSQLVGELTEWCAHWATSSTSADLWAAWRSDHPWVEAEEAADALAEGTRTLGVPDAERSTYFATHLSAVPGWVAHLRWRDQHSDHDLVVGFLAAAVTAEAHALADRTTWTAPGDGLDVAPHGASVSSAADRSAIWLEAYERAVHDPLLHAIAAAEGGTSTTRSRAQIVCCIDVRSEGLRRQLEQVGPYETFGYAGFFGLAAHFDPIGGGTGTDQLPVLLQPAIALREVPDRDDPLALAAEIERRRAAIAIDDAWRSAKYHPIAPLALAEAAGWIAGPVAGLRTAAPRLAAWVADRLPGTGRQGIETHYDRTVMSVEQQAECLAAILAFGLAPDLARLVVLCGHGAKVDNNPIESGLACGACGGNSGLANARTVAAMGNDPAVRAELAARGAPVPADTWFVPALHDTPTDTVELFDLHLAPGSHRGDIDQLRADLDAAGTRAAEERAATLPTSEGSERSGTAPADRVRAVRTRGRDWAEPVAELGLAGNMAFIVGPRTLTARTNLHRRAFLHSYDSDADPEGTTLRGILTAPLIVAQWISAQYYFSTTDPDQFGAGTKTVHNVLGDIGLLRGPGGDLCRGLPLQSVRAGSRLLHEPVRLMAVVQGSPEHIDDAIAGSLTLRQLVDNEWILLVARPDADSPWRQRRAEGWSDRVPAPTGESASVSA